MGGVWQVVLILYKGQIDSFTFLVTYGMWLGMGMSFGCTVNERWTFCICVFGMDTLDEEDEQ